MGNLRDIRRRIKSVKNTSQITRAMQMVASAKMRRAQDQAVKGRPYIRALAEVLYHLQDEIDTSNSPLMQTHGGADLVLLVNTDRGLCGGLNANLIKMVREQAPENAHYITIGRKLNAALAKLNERLEATWSLTDPLSLLELKPVFDFIVQKFKAEEYGRVFVAFSGFVNTMVQKPVFRQLLPIEPEPLMNMAKAGGSPWTEQMPISNSCWNPAPLLCWIPSCLFTFSTDWFRLCWRPGHPNTPPAWSP